ncbi:MAG: radical SAM protein [Deltaproteobacteria bacterium]|nr:radical SAM protein [Deltaproteobacteria bacterium]
MESAPPFLISWNITRQCNLKCAHCYLDAKELSGEGELTTLEAKKALDRISSTSPQAMLILTGGEPLLRPDIFEIASYASAFGFTVVIGTNGTLINDNSVKRLMDGGVKGFGLSLDSAGPAYHDRFRGMEGAWGRTMEAIDILRENKCAFQLQFTATRENKNEIPGIIRLAVEKGAMAVNIFFLVCTGRGQEMTDLTPKEYEEVLRYIARAGQDYKGRLLVRARCAPHFVRIASEEDIDSASFTSGCIAGKGYLRVSPDGFVTPCPYIPVNSGSLNIKDSGFGYILENDPMFKLLSTASPGGPCRDCEFALSCGGCRARALASTGDLMGADPWCEYEPEKKAAPQSPSWTTEAEERLKKVPVFLRAMVRRGVEAYAKKKGLCEITPEVMAVIRKRVAR